MAVKRSRIARERPVRRVALAFPLRLAHLHTIMRGVVDYAQAHGRWVFTTCGEAHDLSVQTLTRWQGDGVISKIDSEEEAVSARALKIPVVTFVGVVKDPGIPRVMMDQQAIGELAADHLLMRGYRRFGFYGVDGAGYSMIREAAYMERLTKKGMMAHRYLSPNMLDHKQPWDDEIDALCRWIRRLPSPIGIFAVNDGRARMIADACRMLDRKVPEEVGIIGVDNSQLDCEFGSPKLSTIECNWWAVGYKVAKLLDNLMDGSPPPRVDQLIEPSGVIPRESTDVTIVEHPAVAKAVAFTRANLGKSFGVKALVLAAGVSRRYLENSFAQALHRTPGDYIAEMRVERAKELLLTRALTLSRVARECGFSDLRQFRRVFTRVQKMSPRQYRKLNKTQGREERKLAGA